MTVTGYTVGGDMTVAFDPYELTILGDALANANTEAEPLGLSQWRHTASGFFFMASLAARLADQPNGESAVRDFLANGTASTRKAYFNEQAE